MDLISQRKALAAVGKKRVSVQEYKRILRATALGLPADEVKKVVENMRKRIRLCFEHNGGNIPRD